MSGTLTPDDNLYWYPHTGVWFPNEESGVWYFTLPNNWHWIEYDDDTHSHSPIERTTPPFSKSTVPIGTFHYEVEDNTFLLVAEDGTQYSLQYSWCSENTIEQEETSELTSN